MRSVVEIIAAKRDGAKLPAAEIRHVIEAFAADTLPDYQMAALAMAIYFRGLDAEELSVWTDAMRRSGDTLDLSSLGPGRADKHSTGGVGDKLSLMIAPLAACCGVTVPMISGRGLGHTGGTIDKLEAIPGFSAEFEGQALIDLLNANGCAIVGQTDNLVPADKRLYALRDVTGTVAAQDLIVSSIMSKKLAEDIEALVLDVKVGLGGWMTTTDDARELAIAMAEVGAQMGVHVIAYMTRMDAPLGRFVGNACEVAEAIEVLSGSGDETLTELSLTMAAAMVEAALNIPNAEARESVTRALHDGSGLARFRAFVAAQGGDLAQLPVHTGETAVVASTDGYVTGINAREVGLTGVALGAGRAAITDVIDPKVGIRIDQPVGSQVRAGQPVLTVLHGDAGPPRPDLVARLREAVTIGVNKPAVGPAVLGRLERRPVAR